VGYRPSIELEQGVKHFVEWYLEYYHPQRSRAWNPSCQN
jgi:dTDP-D-glucose 4,6-dehydratase